MKTHKLTESIKTSCGVIAKDTEVQLVQQNADRACVMVNANTFFVDVNKLQDMYPTQEMA